MRDKAWLSLIKQQRAIAIIRAPSLRMGMQMVKTAIAGGMTLIEISWNSDCAAELVTHLRSSFPNCVIGVGTILTVKDLKNAIAAGAQFAFTPHINFDLIAIAKRHEIPIIPGALTPTEIMTAWDAKASCVKVFPIQAVGNANYLEALRAPIGHIPMIPTGGVTIENASSMIQAGAIAVGIGGNLFPKQVVESENWTLIERQIKTLMHNLQSVNNSSET
ncbi:bifunctional 4-hydroxy-2-oxoglutarate aldolase/2-dehydro-3-deoxy-phosphogluconate aldolase [Leptolyngbya sp. FACHB-17]|uniref:bifunctional 4-hydroxy-2-oxoglutarate aldolase/2-dehydro-3-deoxy-phosphogluconate aldolase n=1 Tax=unclassified Leptolyngbya TaxID=2650499 RepID=UPI0016803C68|nr:bifunctional 4-hydroxy-2-oxoglutarate aldolase/2-dehydro-3-deoxy-phosphogluconate aldolase [Leptolyngbya sp. FACHB-17]MBD2079660.1 bifunctional 4-hydroxy-2-oxoglutarate aldolase/2-dehydro-3-deoxy-phosphogluconate aldolase [Leptolyngbya sp. FACHB-17]